MKCVRLWPNVAFQTVIQLQFYLGFYDAIKVLRIDKKQNYKQNQLK